MSLRNFRRSNQRNRRLFISLSIIGLLLASRLGCPASSDVSPFNIPLTSGEYRFVAVSDSGMIRVAAPAHVRAKHSVESLAVRLLAVQIRRAKEATEILRQQTRNIETVALRFDRRRITDDTQELQAYIFVDARCLNEELVRLGLAIEDTHPSDAGPMIRRIKKAEQDARESRRGVWQ